MIRISAASLIRGPIDYALREKLREEGKRLGWLRSRLLGRLQAPGAPCGRPECWVCEELHEPN